MSTAVGQELSVQVAGLNVRYWEGGAGEPLLIIHHDIGNDGWVDAYGQLAGRFRVLVPELPGYGKSDRPAWARHPRDIALLLQLFLDKLNVDSAVLVGLGFGGWIAAEMAVMSQRRFRRMVLAGTMGIKPSEGEIMDQMMIDFHEYAEAGCADRESFIRIWGEERSKDQQLAWDYAREMTARLAWKPYMFSHQLPHLLGSVEIPTLVVWGSANKVVPLVCGEAYARALPNAKLVQVAEAGLWVEREQPEALTRLIEEHVGWVTGNE
jgi:pimeloyl-ACP methyl ester carboxylesterase